MFTSKDKGIEVDGIIIEVLPNAVFKAKIKDTDLIVEVRPAGKLRVNNIRILLQDKVKIELSPYDPSKGRILYRYR